MSRNESCTGFSYTEVYGCSMALIDKLNSLIRVITMSSDLIGGDSTQLLSSTIFVELFKSQLECLTIHNDIIINRIQQLSFTFFRQSISMIHRIKFRSKEIDRYLPLFFTIQNMSLLRCFFIVPNNIDLRYHLSVTFSLSISFQIFL